MKRPLLAALCALALHAQAVQVLDDRGAVVEIAQPPRRIVSMLPSLTEVVCELGACARLVGVDDYSNWPPRAGALPRVGGLEDSNIEKIVALAPDLVLVASSSRAASRLEGLGIKVVALEPKTLAQLHRAWLMLAQVVDAPQAAASWQRLEAAVHTAAQGLPAALRGTTVYFEVDDGPYAASEASFVGELLARIGVANVVPGRLGPFPKLNPEFVVRADPQVIIISQREAQGLAGRPGWSRIRAVRDRHVCLLSAQQGDVLVRPGPRMAQAAQIMVDCIRGRGKDGVR